MSSYFSKTTLASYIHKDITTHSHNKHIRPISSAKTSILRKSSNQFNLVFDRLVKSSRLVPYVMLTPDVPPISRGSLLRDPICEPVTLTTVLLHAYLSTDMII